MLVLALGTVLTGLTDDISTTPDWNIIAAQVVAAIGLLFAGDGGKEEEKKVEKVE